MCDKSDMKPFKTWAMFDIKCTDCRQEIAKGDEYEYAPAGDKSLCLDCASFRTSTEQISMF